MSPDPADASGSDDRSATEAWTRRSRSFGQVADAYDRYRPSYPDQLYREIIARAPGARVLEAGAGTGIATRALASLGAPVVAVEHDPGMADVARARTQGLDVEVVVSRFEDYEPVPGAFDMVIAAQAWHWIDPVAGPAVAHRALRQDGNLCIWWNRPREFSGPVWEAIHRVYEDHAPALNRERAMLSRDYGTPSPQGYAGFGEWNLTTYEWDQSFEADSFIGFLATHSDHVLLPPATSDALLGGIHGAITAGGGFLTYAWRTLLYVARKS